MAQVWQDRSSVAGAEQVFDARHVFVNVEHGGLATSLVRLGIAIRLDIQHYSWSFGSLYCACPFFGTIDPCTLQVLNFKWSSFEQLYT